MSRRNISTQTTLTDHGLVRLSGTIGRNPHYTFEDRQFEPAWIVDGLTAIDADGNTIQGWEMQGERRVFICSLEQCEVDQCEQVLIDKYLEDESSIADRMVDDAIQRGMEYKHRAYA